MMNTAKFVIVAGYGWSGSSAVCDLLKEYEGFAVPDVEFRLMKDPYGILDLENSLLRNWNPINADASLKDFIWLCKKCNKPVNSKFSQFGLNYKNLLTKNFMNITYEYVNSIIDFKYMFNSYNNVFKMTYLQYITYKLNKFIYRNTAIHLKQKSTNLGYFSHPTNESFLFETRKYINSLFVDLLQKERSDIIVLDQAISPTNIDASLKYFESSKLIVVDRDPRDIYIDLIQNQSLIGVDLASTNDIDKYVKWHTSLRSNPSISQNVLYLTFEELVENYHNTKLKIEEFLSIDESRHIKQKFYFDPEKSKKNIGIWNNHHELHDVIITIERKLNLNKTEE